ncbi:MAG: hypothetical protein ACR2GH_02340 [Pseudonocardia sp.]
MALPETTLFGCRLVAVVALDLDAHRARQASGEGPQRDADTLAVWEWPEAAGYVPPTAPRPVRGAVPGSSRVAACPG